MFDLKEKSVADIANVLRLSPKNVVVKAKSTILLEAVENQDKKFIELEMARIDCFGQRMFFMIIDDVSPSKLNESLEKVTENYKKALGSTVHELRTPLNGVISMLDMLEFEISEELNDKYLRTASTSAKLLLNLVNDILDFS